MVYYLSPFFLNLAFAKQCRKSSWEKSSSFKLDGMINFANFTFFAPSSGGKNIEESIIQQIFSTLTSRYSELLISNRGIDIN